MLLEDLLCTILLGKATLPPFRLLSAPFFYTSTQTFSAFYISSYPLYTQRIPVLISPSAGATAIRCNAVKTLLSSGHFTVIKGNEREIQTVYGSSVSQRGVDSSSSLSIPQRATLARALARRTGAVVILTGKTDVVSDASRTFRVDNGHDLLGQVTGTGCTLGTTVSAMVAAFRSDVLVAALAGLVLFEIAAERAAVRDDVRGPGTFVPAFIDELSAVRKETAGGNVAWVAKARIEALEVEEESA